MKDGNHPAVRKNARDHTDCRRHGLRIVQRGRDGVGRRCSASAVPARESGAGLRTPLRGDLSRYLSARRTAEHISAVSLRVTFPGTRPAIALATGTTRYTGGPPARCSAGASFVTGPAGTTG
jgi:hypothetical protein